MKDIPWKSPWRALKSELEITRFQNELEKEIGPKHPLWGRNPQVIGCCKGKDDILVRLQDESFACVHLVWHGKIDMYPDKYPRTYFYSSVADFLARLEQDAFDYSEEI